MRRFLFSLVVVVAYSFADASSLYENQKNVDIHRNELKSTFAGYENQGGSNSHVGGVSNSHSDVHIGRSVVEEGSLAKAAPVAAENNNQTHSGVTGTIGNLIRQGAGIVGNAASGIVRTVQRGADLVEDVAEGAVKTGAALVKTGTNIAGNVGTTVVKTGTEIVRTGAEIVEGVGTGIVHAGTAAVERGAEIVENVGVGVVHAGAEVVRTGTSVVADVGSGIVRTGTEIVGTVSSDFAEKGTKIVGDVAKIVRTNFNATANVVRNEFTRHRVHEHPRSGLAASADDKSGDDF